MMPSSLRPNMRDNSIALWDSLLQPSIAASASSTKRLPSSPPLPSGRCRWLSWSRQRPCPARPPIGSRWRCTRTGCSIAMWTAASCPAGAWPNSRPRCPIRCVLAAAPVLAWVRDEVGESAQLYRVDGNERLCIAVAERATGLRTTVPVGTRLPLTAGSGAQVLCAWRTEAEPCRSCCRRLSSPLGRWPRFAAAVGPNRSRNAKPALPRCRPRCAPRTDGSSPHFRSRARSSGWGELRGCAPGRSWWRARDASAPRCPPRRAS